MSRAGTAAADEAMVAAFVKDRLPKGWMVEFSGREGDWTATVLHSREPAGWPAFTVLRHRIGTGFVSVWPCGSHVGGMVDDLETALGVIPGGIFAAAEERYGALDGPENRTRH